MEGIEYSSKLAPEIVAELEALNSEATEIIAEFARILDAFEPPPIIYHYTNSAGLAGIIQSGKLWLSDVFAMNDPFELRHGFRFCVDMLRSKGTSGRPEIEHVADRLAKFLLEGIDESAHYFVCSFSLADDDPEQWKDYADDGKGFALGFDARALISAFTTEGENIREGTSTFPVTYDDKPLVQMHSKILERTVPAITFPRGKGLSADTIKAYELDLLTSISMNAIRPALFFKHKDYQKEQELRFLEIYRGDQEAPDLKVRNREGATVRYREFDWRTAHRAALKRVVVGPAAGNTVGVKFVMDCLESANLSDLDVIHSKALLSRS